MWTNVYKNKFLFWKLFLYLHRYTNKTIRTMKKILLLVFVLSVVITGNAQTTHQSEILSFVNNNIGKKVGRGICYELVQSAIRQYNPRYDMGSIKKATKRYGKKVKQKYVQPGDVIIEQGSRIYHVGIVYKVSNDSIFVAEQNTNGCIKKSVVEINYLDFAELKNICSNAKVSFYRPE
jgi:hypothetical protein